MPVDGRVNTRTPQNRRFDPYGVGDAQINAWPRHPSRIRVCRRWVISLVRRRPSRDAWRLIPEHLVNFQDPWHIGHGLGKRWNLSAIAVHRVLSRIVGGKSESHILAEAVDEKL